MIGYEKVSPKSFIAGDTARWYSKFDDIKFNILGGYAPIIDWNFEYGIINKQFQISPLQKEFSVPITKKNVTHLSVTIVDNDSKDFLYALLKWIHDLPISKNKAIDLKNLEKYAKEFYIFVENKKGIVQYYYRFKLLPGDSLTDNGTSDFQAKTYPYTFNVIGFEVIFPQKQE